MYLNHGMYDPVEAAGLVRVSPATLVGWLSATKSRPALLKPSLGGLLSFHDLISLRVIAELRHHGAPLKRIAEGIRWLQSDWGTPSPLAHQNAVDNLAAAAGSVFARPGPALGWEDVGRGGQQSLQDVILPLLRRIEYGPDDLAAIWRPMDGVWRNPRVQAGASCVDPTRIATRVISRRLDLGESSADIAWDYDLDIADVTAAKEFERSLVAAA